MLEKDKIVIRSIKTSDMSDKYIRQIYDLYEIVFHERRSNKFFLDQFGNTSKGYSYHALAFDGDKIVGHNAYVPFDYIFRQRRFSLVLSIDAMVHPDYQGLGIYSRLLHCCEKTAIAEGCKMRVGFPNGNSYPIQMKAFKYLDLGTLDIYCLPLKPGAFKGVFAFINPFTTLIARLKTKKITKDLSCAKESLIHRDRTTFNSYRYKWFNADYVIKELPDSGTFVYKQTSFKGIPALFLMDVYPMTRYNFEYAASEMVRTDSNVAVILYAGNLPFKQSALFKMPQKLRPKQFHFVAKVFEKDFINPIDLTIDNWDINLSSFDLL